MSRKRFQTRTSLPKNHVLEPCNFKKLFINFHVTLLATKIKFWFKMISRQCFWYMYITCLGSYSAVQPRRSRNKMVVNAGPEYLIRLSRLWFWRSSILLWSTWHRLDFMDNNRGNLRHYNAPSTLLCVPARQQCPDRTLRRNWEGYCFIWPNFWFKNNGEIESKIGIKYCLVQVMKCLNKNATTYRHSVHFIWHN